MTQVKCRTAGGKGMTQAAWKYLMHREIGLDAQSKVRARREAMEEAEKKNVTLPKLKWMDGK